MDYKISEQERDALYGLPHLQQLIYFRGIRPFMDFRTGMVGVKRGISYQSLAEECFVESHSHFSALCISRDQVRRAIEGLCRAGILLRLSTSKKLIVQCLLATQDYSTQNRSARSAPRRRHTSECDGTTTELMVAPHKDSSSTTLLQGNSATPPGSDQYNHSLSERTVKESVPDNFEPSSDTLHKAYTEGCLDAANTQERLRFILYHQSKGTQSCNWDAEYFRWLLNGKRYLEQEKKYGRSDVKTHQRNSKRPTGSAVWRAWQANRDVITGTSEDPFEATDHYRKGHCLVVDSDD